jgi:hypothetical protein
VTPRGVKPRGVKPGNGDPGDAEPWGVKPGNGDPGGVEAWGVKSWRTESWRPDPRSGKPGGGELEARTLRPVIGRLCLCRVAVVGRLRNRLGRHLVGVLSNPLGNVELAAALAKLG